MNAGPRRTRLLNRAWLRSSSLSFSMSLIVAAGVGDGDWGLPVAVLMVAAIGLGLLHYLFPRGVHFAFGTATGLALYASLFAVLGRAAFPDVYPTVRVFAFCLPAASFLGFVWLRRAALVRLAENPGPPDPNHMPGILRWLGGLLAVATVSFALPINRWTPVEQSLALVFSMATISLLVALTARDVVRLLTDAALILEEMAGRAAYLLVPVVAFLILYALLVIGFASVYRIADSLSVSPLFHGAVDGARLTFADALHFSVVTLSTVGYGDIRPSDDGIRLLAGVQMVAGQVLLLFGFSEVMRSRRAQAVNDDQPHRHVVAAEPVAPPAEAPPR
ncbi:potassium channel family protein [Humitalea sp. 24SJ18S-53]|uniref:potassium channel family protein n=1 Tax=Humitalea sp. 24SJ18S-53 TaxID=3422307 RepID=UPI003D67D9A1